MIFVYLSSRGEKCYSKTSIQVYKGTEDDNRTKCNATQSGRNSRWSASSLERLRRSDGPSAPMTCHVCTPWTLLDFLQSAGTALRDHGGSFRRDKMSQESIQPHHNHRTGADVYRLEEVIRQAGPWNSQCEVLASKFACHKGQLWTSLSLISTS